MSKDLFRVYDIWDTKTVRYYANSSKENVYDISKNDGTKKDEIQEYLILPTSAHKNSKPYVVQHKKVILDDLEITEDKLSLDNGKSNVFTPHQVLKNIESRKEKPNETQEEKEIRKALDKEASSNLTKWFNAHNGVDLYKMRDIDEAFLEFSEDIQQKPIDEKLKQYSNSLIIPIPDFIGANAQDAILHAAKLNSSTQLIWRSVAAVIGAEDEIQNLGLKKGDVILVEDNTDEYTLITKIEVEVNSQINKLIPCHFLYHDDDLETRNSNYYPFFSANPRDSSIKTSFDLGFRIVDGFIRPSKRDVWESKLNPVIKEKARLILKVGSGKSVINYYYDMPILFDKENIFISRGAARYGIRSKNKIISYYDQSRNLSIVLQNKKEEVYFKTLIEQNKKIPGGIVQEYPEVRGIYLQTSKGSVKFYLNLGANLPNKQLKELEQEFDFSEYVKNASLVIPLILHPSFTSGQGNAQVHITADFQEFPELKDVSYFLDWNTMNLAFSILKNSKKKVPTTLEVLQNELERSFPPAVPPVKSDANSFTVFRESVEYRGVIKNKIDAKTGKKSITVDTDSLIRIINYNQMKRLFPDASDLRRFEMTNCFGSDMKGHLDEGLPSGWMRNQENKEFAKDYLRVLEYCYNESIKNDDKDAKEMKRLSLKLIAWTYQSKFFDKILNTSLKEIESAAKNHGPLGIQYFTLSGNMIHKKEYVTRFLKAFFVRLQYPKRLYYWLYGATRILMFNSDYFDVLDIDIEEYHYAIRNILNIEDLGTSDKIMINSIRCILFLLKVRRNHSNFAKVPNSLLDDKGNIKTVISHEEIMQLTDEERMDFNTYELIKNTIKDSSVYNNWWEHRVREEADLLFKYLDGKGNLDIPVGDIAAGE